MLVLGVAVTFAVGVPEAMELLSAVLQTLGTAYRVQPDETIRNRFRLGPKTIKQIEAATPDDKKREVGPKSIKQMGARKPKILKYIGAARPTIKKKQKCC